MTLAQPATRPSSRWVAVLAVLVAATLALAGCAKLDLAVRINGDTASGTIVFGVDKRLLAETGQSDDEFRQSLASSAPVPEGAGVRAEAFADDRYVGMRYTLADADLDAINASGDPQSLRIVHDEAEHRYKVTGAIDLRQSGDTPTEVLALMRSLEVRIAITFPGKVTKHTGVLDGTTVTWRPRPGERTILLAEAGEAEPLRWLVPAGVTSAALLLMLLGGGLTGGLAWWYQRRGRPAQLTPAGRPR